MIGIDSYKLGRTEPGEQDFILPGFLAGTVGALIAPGATGKSMFALQLAWAIASPQANMLGLSLNRHGSVLYLNLEDPLSEIHQRTYALASKVDDDTLKSVNAGLQLVPRRGVPTDVMNDEFMSELLRDAEGKRLVIIDTLSRFHRLDENDNGRMAELLTRLDLVVDKTGAALLYLHHTSKAAALSGQGGLAQAARGASALIDNARWCVNLIKMTQDESLKLSDGNTIGEARRNLFVKYEVSKQNYAQITESQWYRRTDGGVLCPVKLEPVSSSTSRSRKLEPVVSSSTSSGSPENDSKGTYLF